MSKFAVILAAAGKSERFSSKKNIKKTFVPLCGKAVWIHSAEKFAQHNGVMQIIITVSPDDFAWFADEYQNEIKQFALDVVCGGKERSDSVQNGLNAVREDIDFIAVHDAARPCVSTENIERVFAAAQQTGAALLASPVIATLKKTEPASLVVRETVERADLWEAHTPQVFRRDILLDSFQRRGDFQPTDDVQLAERAGYPVSIVPDSRWNIKITTEEDLLLARQLISD
jgi:2-C-methyl-D-erythritol 4-phosphate cytidylyltransferase